MATTPEFKYAPMFQLGKDTTEYRLLGTEGVSTGEFEGKTILKVSKEALTQLAQQAFHDVEFMLRREHNLQVAKILTDPEASENDKYVALQFLRNAETALPARQASVDGGGHVLRRAQTALDLDGRHPDGLQLVQLVDDGIVLQGEVVQPARLALRQVNGS